MPYTAGLGLRVVKAQRVLRPTADGSTAVDAVAELRLPRPTDDRLEAR